MLEATHCFSKVPPEVIFHKCFKEHCDTLHVTDWRICGSLLQFQKKLIADFMKHHHGIYKKCVTWHTVDIMDMVWYSSGERFIGV